LYVVFLVVIFLKSDFYFFHEQYLTQGQQYYVRVYARNSAGLGSPTVSTPAFVVPGLQVSGKPHTIATSTTGLLPGQIFVSWQRPRIPWCVFCFKLVFL
jgi:hypothetical protein